MASCYTFIKNSKPSCPIQDKYRYLIAFSIDPVEYGFVCDKLGSNGTFKGFNAFNNYFDRLVPNQGVSHLPDVWDGYYRITLVQFETQDHPEKLRKKFASFSPLSVDTQVPEALFRTSKLDANRSAYYRLGSDFCNEPIALYVTAPPQLPFESLLEQIKKRINYTEWAETPRHDLHMNIRLYWSNDKMISDSKLTWDRVCKLGIPEKVSQHPIVFHNSRFEIILSRGDCKKVYGEQNPSQWCLGVTMLNKRCSGCQTIVENEEWKGVCRACRKYESIKPIWSISFSSKMDEANEIKQEEVKSNDLENQNRFNLNLVRDRDLWQKENPVNDTLVVAFSRDVPIQLVEALLQNFYPDLLFLQSSIKDENTSNETRKISKNNRSYIYHGLAEQAGLYYDTAKLELLAIIDTSDFTMSHSQVYSVLLRRRYTEQEKKCDRLLDYSFIAMSYYVPSVCSTDSTERVDDFWKSVSQIQRKIRPTRTSLFPIVLAIHEDTGIGTKVHELPETWLCCKSETENQEKDVNDTYLCYYDSDTYSKMLIGGLRHIDHHLKENYTKKQWKNYKTLCNQPPVDPIRTANRQFGMAFIGFRF